MPLVLVSTPIGNLGDLSPRAVQALSEADWWLVEDTRVSGKLLAHLSLKKPMKVLNEHTSEAKIEQFVQAIASGERVALLTDAGSPGISDPGAALADKCYETELEVDAVPGPSAVTAALMLSGFFAQRFAFLGYLPRKEGDMRAILDPFSSSPMTLVLFESPFRTEKLLEVLHKALGGRRYALCREMTKAHQQVFRGRLPETPEATEVPRKGEFTVVVEGLRRRASVELE
jgi:16S rRNA (cytidine1402-2'-O)-methyltransferase